jgi:hypothetical protein
MMDIVSQIDSVLEDTEWEQRARENGLEKIPKNVEEVVELLFGGEPLYDPMYESFLNATTQEVRAREERERRERELLTARYGDLTHTAMNDMTDSYRRNREILRVTTERMRRTGETARQAARALYEQYYSHMRRNGVPVEEISANEQMRELLARFSLPAEGDDIEDSIRTMTGEHCIITDDGNGNWSLRRADGEVWTPQQLYDITVWMRRR